jgi:predicted subunit of tRNA(5-methylaminomethyl-2-thiouridylate) methyltransferase
MRREKRSDTMQELQIERRIALEEKLAIDAVSPDLALAHRQVARLYKNELAISRRKRAATTGQMLAEIW